MIMNKKYQSKVIQSIVCGAVMAMIAFGNFSVITICFLEILFVLSATYSRTAKYITQWKNKKQIENKQEFIKDILFIVLLYLIIITIVIYKSII